MGKSVASVSFGKDSTAMLILLVERGEPLDEVVFYDTGVEFDAIYRNRDKVVKNLLAPNGIKYTELRYSKPFFYYMLSHEYTGRDGKKKRGYGWCGGVCRWGTKQKTATLDKYIGDVTRHYVGIAADEKNRLPCIGKITPLADWGITEAEALRICYAHGYDFDGLYRILKRVSCWCCRNKNLQELAAYKQYLPEYFGKLCLLEQQIGEPMKGDRFLTERVWQNTFLLE